MKTLELDGNDLKISKEQFLVIENEVEVAQSLSTLLAIRKGEFALDEHVGLEHGNLLGKSNNLDEARDDIIECLSADERVELVDDVEITISNRQAAVKFAVKMADDEKISDEVVINA